MSGYTPSEWLQKADYEGGLEEAILGYGLDETDLDQELAPDLWEAIRHFRQVAKPASEYLHEAAGRHGW